MCWICRLICDWASILIDILAIPDFNIYLFLTIFNSWLKLFHLHWFFSFYGSCLQGVVIHKPFDKIRSIQSGFSHLSLSPLSVDVLGSFQGMDKHLQRNFFHIICDPPLVKYCIKLCVCHHVSEHWRNFFVFGTIL